MKITLDFTANDVLNPPADLFAEPSISDQWVGVLLGLAMFLAPLIVVVVLMRSGFPTRLATMEAVLTMAATTRISTIWRLKNQRRLILGNLRRYWRLTLREKDQTVLTKRVEKMRHFWQKLVRWDRDWIPGSNLIAVLSFAIEGFRGQPFPFAWFVLVVVICGAIILKVRSSIVKDLLRESPDDLKHLLKFE